MLLPWIRAAFIVVALFLPGCGSAPRPKSVSVYGKVVGPSGKSVGPATVTFWPEDSKNNQGAGAVCEADGSFHLQCIPGSYKATVSPIRPKGATTAPPPQGSESLIPTRYQNELTTTLTVKVPATGSDSVILNLK
jgi:hypothetical protein